MIVATADFETANTAGVDLKKVGADAYAQHPATEVLCLCVKWVDPRFAVRPGAPAERRITWVPGCDTGPLAELARDPMVVFEAHNAAFEQLVWRYIMEKRYGLPSIPIARWKCTMACALYHGMPGKLDKAAEALNLQQQKDMVGSALTIGLSSPITKKAWAEDWMPADWPATKKAYLDLYPDDLYDRRPQTIKKVVDYCWQDVAVEEELSNLVGGLSYYERQVWEHDQLVNQRGLKVDVPFVQAAMHIIAEASASYRGRFSELTGGINTGQLEQMHAWLQRQGVELPNLQAATVDGVLGGSLEDEFDGVVLPQSGLAANVREVLEIRRLLGATAIKKYPAMLRWVGDDEIARYLLQYHGAGTGRWAGRGFQPQNFPRLPVMVQGVKEAEPIDPELVVTAIMQRDWRLLEMVFGINALKVCARALRHALVARPGNVFCAADFAGIEMRIVLALAGEYGLCDLLVNKLDIYLFMAEDIYKAARGSMNKVTHVQERTIGKNTILGCGFQMSGPTFHDRYCSHMPLEFADQVVRTYREETAPKVPALWRAFEDTALDAVLSGFPRQTHGCVFRPHQQWLCVDLPDGQTMWYRAPTPCTGRFGNPAWECRRWKDGQWKWVQMYGGLITENIVQKMARGLLVEGMRRVEKHGYPVVLHTHDEIVAEPRSSGDNAKLQKEFEEIMAETPGWAKQIRIPIGVEGWCGPRYRK